MLCKRERLVPHGKSKRWFRCDYCSFLLSDDIGAEEWLNGTGICLGDVE
jgi:hypothetical protein